MAFFGLTLLGYQNPIGDNMIEKPTEASYPRDGGTYKVPPSNPEEQQTSLRSTCQPLPYSTDIHHKSHQRHKEMVRRAQAPRSPDQLYQTPLTDSQQYGWMLSKGLEPWMKVKHFPRKNSEMTKFVDEMSRVDKDFFLF